MRRNMQKLECPHKSKTHRMIFSCHNTGDYVIELCKNCKDQESTKYLIKEEEIIS